MQLNKSNIELQTAIRTGERYWMATLILTVIIIACVAVIVEKQIEANMCWSGSQVEMCWSGSQVEMAQIVGKMSIEKETNHAVILKKQTDQFLNRIFTIEDKAIKGVEDCQKHLRDIETSTRKLVMNAMTSLAVERDKLATKYNTCSEKLTACETTIKDKS